MDQRVNEPTTGISPFSTTFLPLSSLPMHPDFLSPKADAGHPGGHPPPPGRNCPEPIFCDGGFLGQKKSLSRADSGQVGHPIVLCPGDREDSTSDPGVMGSKGYRGCSWKAGLMHQGQPGPKRTSTSLLGQQSCASSHDRAGEMGVNSQLL